jgi:hypothetical protein
MKIFIDLTVSLEYPDADIFPPKKELENDFVKMFKGEGLVVHGIEITNYRSEAGDD